MPYFLITKGLVTLHIAIYNYRHLALVSETIANKMKRFFLQTTTALGVTTPAGEFTNIQLKVPVTPPGIFQGCHGSGMQVTIQGTTII